MFTVIATSFTSLSAASIERSRCLENESYHTKSKSDTGEDAISPEILTYRAKALRSLYVFSKAGLKIAKSFLQFVRKHPGKTLASFLALQNKISLIKIPGATALSVTNLYQNITSNDTMVPLLPMITTVGNDVTACVTFVFRDTNSGNISSSCPLGGLVPTVPFTFSNMTCADSPGWVTGGFQDELNHILHCAFVTRALGYFNTIYINSTFDDISGHKAQGLIQINWPTAYIPSTTLTNQSPSTTDTSTRASNIPSSNSPITQSLSTISSVPPTATFTQPINNNSIVATTPTSNITYGITTSTTDTASTLAVPASSPPYAIIGGAVSGGLVLCSIMAGIVAYVRTWYARQQESSPSQEQNQDSGSGYPRSADYGLIVVAHSQNLKPSEYDDISAVSSRSQTDLHSQPDSNSGYASLSLAPMKN